MNKICLIGFTLCPGLSKRIEYITGLTVQHISSSGPSSGIFNSIWNPSLDLWRYEVFDENEFRFILNYYSEIIECLSRPHRLEPLKLYAVQDYHLILKQIYLQVKLSIFTNSPSLVIFGDVPHDGPDLVIATLCKLYKIPCYAAWQLPFAPCFSILPTVINTRGIFWDFSSRYKAKKACLDSKVASSIAKYCKHVYNGGGYSYMKDLRVRGFPKLRDAKKGVNALKALQRFTWYSMIHLKQWRYSKKITELSKDFDIDNFKPFIYFPLHMQPEMTSSALGGRTYNDQALLVNQLSSLCQKHGAYLVLKENPKQSFSHRSSIVLKNIRSSANVVFAPTSYSTDTLIRNSTCVATISGTVGIESIARKKNVFVAGTSWYIEHPKVMSRFADLEKFLGEHEKPCDTEGLKLEMFMENIAKTSWSGCSDSRYCSTFNITTEVNEKILGRCLSTFVGGILGISLKHD